MGVEEALGRDEVVSRERRSRGEARFLLCRKKGKMKTLDSPLGSNPSPLDFESYYSLSVASIFAIDLKSKAKYL